MMRLVAFAVTRPAPFLLDKAVSKANYLVGHEDFGRWGAFGKFGAPEPGDLMSCRPICLQEKDLNHFSARDAARFAVHLSANKRIRCLLSVIPSLSMTEWDRLASSQEVVLQEWRQENLVREIGLYPRYPLELLELYFALPRELILTRSQMLATTWPAQSLGRMAVVGVQYSLDPRPLPRPTVR
jgi:hypothetical protein